VLLLPIGSLGVPELLLILFILLLIFGASRIPEIARSLGEAIKEFRRGLEEGEESGGRGESKSESEKR
jgi:sec-independent protein translocase protein TatA